MVSGSGRSSYGVWFLSIMTTFSNRFYSDKAIYLIEIVCQMTLVMALLLTVLKSRDFSLSAWNHSDASDKNIYDVKSGSRVSFFLRTG